MSWKSVIVGIGVVAFGIVLLVSTGAGQRLVLGLLWRKAGMTSTVERIPNAKTPGSYYRYRTVFRVDGSEELVFDNVVACNTRITRSKAHGESVLNGITPNLFVRRTKDNHALLVVTPELCSWARGNSPEKNYTVEGFMPPAVVWFDDADDLTFGIAYVTRTAYATKKSRLELVSTYVGPATREEFEAWYDGPRKENLAKQEWIAPPPGTTRKRYDAYNAYLKSALETRGRAFPRTCYAAHRLKLTDEARAIIRSYWPKDRPRYWTPTSDEWDLLHEKQFTGKPFFIGKGGRTASRNQFWLGFRYTLTFGANENERSGYWPAETYPAATNVTFLTGDVTDKDFLIQKIFFENGGNDGFAWCYRATGLRVPSFDHPDRRHHFVEIDNLRARSSNEFKNQIQHVFERDEYMFRFFNFGIHPNGGIE